MAARGLFSLRRVPFLTCLSGAARNAHLLATVSNCRAQGAAWVSPTRLAAALAASGAAPEVNNGCVIVETNYRVCYVACCRPPWIMTCDVVGNLFAHRCGANHQCSLRT